MKPAQIIQREKKKFERIISDAATTFADETGGAILRIDVAFIDVQKIGDEYKQTVIGRVDVKYLL